MFYLSEKLRTYIENVQTETRRPVRIQITKNMGLSGMVARFQDHPTDILVEVIPQITKEQFEQSVAHEVTHGFLAYGHGYCRLSPLKHSLTQLERDNVSLLITMIEDIVVNKILQDNGFQPFAFNYLNVVQRETKAARRGRDYYKQFQDPTFKDRFMVFRYIMAWGFLEYFKLDQYARRTLAKFENEFRSSYPKQYELASQIKAVILQNNIFVPEGYCNALKKSLEIWGLDGFVKVSPILKKG